MITCFFKNKMVFLSLLLVACTPSPKPSGDNPTPATLTPDWGIASNIVALEGNLLAVGDMNSYHIWVDDPALPKSTIDLGLRFTPNSELIAHLHKSGKIKQVIDSDFYAQIRPQYRDLPLTSINFYTKTGKATWQDFETATLDIGKAIGKQDNAHAYNNRLKQDFVALGKTLHARYPTLQKIAIVQFMDSNTLRMYGESSVFAPPTELLGLTLTSLNTANEWGFSNITLGDLAGLDKETCLLVIKPFGQVLQNDLQKSLVWQRLDFGGSRCFGVLEPIWMYGGLVSMQNFGTRLTQMNLTGIATNYSFQDTTKDNS